MEQKFTNEVLEKLTRKKRKQVWNRILSVMMSIVVFCTTYILILPAITKETKTYCGSEEHIHVAECYRDVQTCQIHVHADDCYTDDVLICTEESDPEHSHTESCKEQELICGKEEHIHSQACFSDPTADLENEESWTATLPELTGVGRDDLVAIAKSQAGYTESSNNYLVDDDGNVKGYTRYGAWYGSPYDDWNAMFVAFCLHYADVNYPVDVSIPAWAEALKEQELFKLPSDYIPKPGDIVFFDSDEDGTVDRVGLVETIESINITTFEGDSADRVARNTYDLFDKRIVGYGVVNAIKTETDEDAPETESGTDAPETESGTDAPETESGTDAPETESGTDAPETELSTDAPETESGTDAPETEMSTDAPETETEAEPPETETEAEAEDEPGEDNSAAGGAYADLIEPAEPITQTREEYPQVYRFRSSSPTGASTYSMRRSASTYGVTQRAAPLDLTPYIDSVTMYDSNGNPLGSGSTVSEKDVIRFEINYTIIGQQLGFMNGEDVTVNSNTLTYTLPSSFTVVRSESGNIRNSAGTIVGTYVIDSNTRTVTMTFSDEYVDQNARGIQIEGDVSFYSTVTKVTESDKENQNYKFTDTITLGVVIEEEREAVGDLKIEKKKTDVNGEYITYEIKVSSTNGTNGSITVTDTMAKGLTFNSGGRVTDKYGRNVNASFNATAGQSSFTMTLPEMSPGDYYTVTYTCKADIDLLDVDMTVRNTAEVNGKDSEGFDLKDKITVDHTFDVLKKTGVLNEENNTITWTITVNRDKVDISGWKLKDIVRTNGVSTSYTGPVTIKDSSGRTLASNVSLPYTFPAGSKDTYTVTYTTAHDFGDGQMIYNSAILYDEDTEVTVLSGVGIGSPFLKTGEAGEIIKDENGNYLLPITWTVTIDTTKGAIPGGEVFTDILENATGTGNDMYMTYDQLMGALANFEAALMDITGQDAEAFSAEVHKPGFGISGEEYNINQLRNNEKNCQSKKYGGFNIKLKDKGIPKGNILTFSYEAYGVFPNNVISTTSYFNRFSLFGQYEVEGRVDHTIGTIKATKSALNYYDPNGPIGNKDWQLQGTEGSAGFTYENLHDAYLAWAIELSVPPHYTGTEDIIIYEDLPDGVSVKGLDLSSLSNVPTSRLILRDIEPGHTYSWDFMLYPADKYGTYNPQGEQVSITIQVTEAGDLVLTFPGEIFKTMSERIEIDNQWAAEDNKLTEWWTYLYIYTQIDDDFEWTPRAEGSQIYVNQFENRFTMENEHGDVIDIGSQTQTITKDEREGTIRKDADMEDNVITYSVVLNAYKKDLIEFSGTYNVNDELTYRSTDAKPLRLRLVPGSVKLYEIRVKSDGGYTILGELTANYTYTENSSVVGGGTNWVHNLDLNVPDGKSLLLEYSYKATGDKSAAYEVKNVCTISGVGEGSIDGEKNIEIEIKDATAQADTKGVMLYKVDAANNGVYLENAVFNIYIWNEQQGKYIIVHHPKNGETDFTTDAYGMIVLDSTTLDQFAYNTAYYIVEVASPNGYYISPEPYYFYIVNDDYEFYGPDDFEGQALVSGDIIYRNNVSQFTEISIEKYWKNYDGEYVTVTADKVSKITVELWQMLQGDPGSAKVYGTYTVTPDAKGNWSLTVTKLPKATAKADGTKDKDYLYYIKEVNVGGYTLESAENNGGINSGTIKLVNRETDGYVLPETGGTGTQIYTISGLLLVSVSTAILMKKRRKCRKEEKCSP